MSPRRRRPTSTLSSPLLRPTLLVELSARALGTKPLHTQTNDVFSQQPSRWPSDHISTNFLTSFSLRRLTRRLTSSSGVRFDLHFWCGSQYCPALQRHCASRWSWPPADSLHRGPCIDTLICRFQGSGSLGCGSNNSFILPSGKGLLGRHLHYCILSDDVDTYVAVESVAR